ncbi:hypothetical protein ACIBK8_33925 [Streptomyces sp. NPDC050161]|uniref:hypothetical protein n=1 Tax=Streptomyces sp. NPDC050161 TaxID=3365604 RepID=UPI003797CD44
MSGGSGVSDLSNPSGMGEVSGTMRTDEAINEIEGYLLWEAEKSRARTRAEAFCAGLPWLTDSQRAEVERLYCQDQAELSKAYLQRIATRSASLRAEYSGVYQVLRRRLFTAFAAGSVAVAAAATAVAVVLTAR